MIKANTKMWTLHCFLLFSPFAFETFVAAPLMLTNEPQWLWGALFWVHTYITYGAVCLIHLKWRKTTGEQICLIRDTYNKKWIVLAILIGAAAGHLADAVFGHGIVAPMLYRDIIGTAKQEPLWMSIGGFAMQYIYYIFEFTVVAFMVDCAQKTSGKIGWTQKVPWGGIFLAITWGFNHYFSKGSLTNGFSSMLLCLFIGLAYMLPGKKPVYAWLAIAAGYWL